MVRESEEIREDIERINHAVVVVQHELEAGRHREVIHECVRAQVATAWRLGIYYDLLPWEGDVVRNRLLKEAYALLKQSPEVYQPSEGKFKGRAPTARRKADEVKALAGAGMTREAIAGKLGMSERSVYRVLAS